MAEYKFYQDTDFDIADGATILTMADDLNVTRSRIEVVCDAGEITCEIEHSSGFGDAITLYENDVFRDGKVKRLKLTASVDNSAYRVIGGITAI